MKKHKLQGLIFIIGLILISCNQKSNSGSDNKLKCIYFGQKLPELTPEIFAPDIVSTQYQNNSSPTFSVDMNEVYWSISFFDGSPNVILYMKRENNSWTDPKVATFSGQYSDGGPFLTPDGQKLFFHSNRPTEKEGAPKDYDIWFVVRTDSGWSEPINAGDKVNTDQFENYPSISRNGTLYFNSVLEGYPFGIGIHKSQLANGKFTDRVILDSKINSKEGFDWCPYIDPDERYILFSSGRDGQEFDDLYCSFKNGEDNWSDPVNLGASVNSEFNDRFPSVSPDGKYLFFSRPKSNFKTYYKSSQTYEQLLDRYHKMNEDVYWISSKIIENLKPAELRP